MAVRSLDWKTAVGQKVRVYRNLNNGLISVQLKEPGKSWFVAGHVKDAVLSGVTFHVSEKGRQRVLKERCKHVHAWAQATLLGEFDDSLKATVRLKYDPYTDCAFVERYTQRPLQSCQFLAVRDNQVFVSTDALTQPAQQRQKLKKLEPSKNWQFQLAFAS